MKKLILIVGLSIILCSGALVPGGKTSTYNPAYNSSTIASITPLSSPLDDTIPINQILQENQGARMTQETPGKTTHTTSSPSRETFAYIILTTPSLVNAVISSDFINWKTSVGYTIKIVLTTDEEITSQPGDNLPAQIRNFLRAYQTTWGITYLLIVGDHQTIPMRYCYPDPTNHYNGAANPGSGGEIPTDYYYADVTASDADSWDKDGDGYYGEYGHDEPDFQAEISVGRIPTSIPSRITYTLDKTVMFEQDTGVWKNAALHAGAFYYLTNENNNGHQAMDAARCMDKIEQEYMDGWTITHFSEQEGLEVSMYNWTPLTHAAFTTAWRDGAYGVVNWGSHANVNRAARKIWSWDDGDGIPETSELTWLDFINTNSYLDDDYPSIVFAMGCLIGCPEQTTSGNLGIDLVTKPDFGSAAAIISSTRTPYGSWDWPTDMSGTESICYVFNRFLINDSQPVGDAFYNAKYYCTTIYGWNLWYEYNNMYIFNLYGDPSLRHKGASVIPHPDLDCDGTLEWSKVKPGAYVNGSFTVKNIGDPSTRLNWSITSYPDWGTWTCTPSSGTNLTPEMGAVTITVELIAPNQKNQQFTGEIIVINTQDPTDYDTITISLQTPVSYEGYLHQLFKNIFEQFPNAFPLLQHFLGY